MDEDLMNDPFYQYLLEQEAMDAAQGGAFNDWTKQGLNVLSLFGNLGGIAAGAGGLSSILSAYDKLGKIGEQALLGRTVNGVQVPGALDIAQMGLEQTAFQPYTVRSTTGSAFGVTPDEYGNLQAAFGLSPEEAALQQQLFGGAGQFYQQAAAPTSQREADVYNRLRAVQAPEEERQRLALEERLASQGRLGVQTAQYGGTPEQLALAQAQEQARNQAALLAMQQAQAEQAQQSQLGQQFLAGAYTPQAQLMNVQQAAQLYPQLAQRGQLTGAGLFGEAAMGGLEALLGAGLGQANLMGQLGTGLLSGIATPTNSYGGLGETLSTGLEAGKQIYDWWKGL